MNLVSYGLSPFWASDPESVSKMARILRVEREHSFLITNEGLRLGSSSGNFRQKCEAENISPCVGDWCLVGESFKDASGKDCCVIEELLERKTQIARNPPGATGQAQVLVANVDFAFLVCSANKDLNIARLKRYAILCETGGVTPVLVLSKTDLCDDTGPYLAELRNAFAQLDIISTAIANPEGQKKILAYLEKGNTGVFLGSSGVGKSTLVNALLGRQEQPTQDIRSDDDKGRHTTTSRNLFQIPEAGLIVDTPGLREVGVIGDEAATTAQFPLIEELVSKCQYNNCGHSNEPGCRIQEAFSNGTLEESEWKQYLKLIREQAFNNRKIEKSHASDTKKRWKEIHLNMRKKKDFEKKNKIR